MNFSARHMPIAAALLCALVVGCGEDNAGNRAAAATPSDAGGAPVAVNPANATPQITGSPPGEATVGQLWVFQPSLYDADGDRLTVTASNLPDWMQLNSKTGRLSGTPDEGDIRTWSGIRLTVSDGNASVTSPPFGVIVVDENSASGSVTLSWLPPTQQVDGSPISELAGYRLLFGQASRDYTQTIAIDNPGITRYTIDGLGSGDWYFAIQSVDSTGLVSEPSAEAYTRI